MTGDDFAAVLAEACRRMACEELTRMYLAAAAALDLGASLEDDLPSWAVEAFERARIYDWQRTRLIGLTGPCPVCPGTCQSHNPVPSLRPIGIAEHRETIGPTT